jgi:hypothetical protein
MTDEKEKRLTRDIDVISRNIRRKYRTLKHGIRESEELFRKSYKPILEPLHSISQNLKEKARVVKSEKEEEEEEGVDTHDYVTPDDDDDVDDKPSPRRAAKSGAPIRFLPTHVLAETMDSENVGTTATAEDILSTPEGRQEARRYIDSTFRGPLARKYIRMSVSAQRARMMDHTYGVRHEDGSWMVGDSTLEIDENDDFHVKGIRYKGTPGLYELMFMKHPDDDVYDRNDLSAYKSILLATNGHKQHYLPGAQVNTNRGVKYKEIISRLFKKKHRGGGGGGGGEHRRDGTYMTFTPNAAIDYVHWDDPNELVARLRLLTASQRSGHTGHTNEIVSIVEELREANVIV